MALVLNAKKGVFVSVAGYIIVTFGFRKEGRRWVAHCEELGTATFGRSLTEAEERLKEAVLLHLNTLEDVGERRRFFEEHNIKFYRTRPRRPATITVPVSEGVFVHAHVQSIPETRRDRELVPTG